MLKANSKTYLNLNIQILKVPGPIASDFLQTLWDFTIRRKNIYFSLPLVNFTAENVPFGRYSENMASYGNLWLSLHSKVLRQLQ